MSEHTNERHISIQVDKKVFLLKRELQRALILFLKSLDADEIKKADIDDSLTPEQFRKEYLDGKPAYAINLKAARERLSLSQVALSELTGIDRSNLNAYENGKKKIGKKVAAKLGKILDVDARVFLIEN